MNNHDFCAAFVRARVTSQDFSILDFGCGDARIVRMLRGEGVKAFGCDVYYDPSKDRQKVDPELISSGAVREMVGGKIPFSDAMFDVVLHNQVFEHIPDLDATVAEIARVLKPSGTMLALFPDSSVWREGHCGVAFLHWFPKGSSFRVWYGATFRMLGFGHFKEIGGPVKWSRFFCDWLDKWTYYRPLGEIHATLAKHFHAPEHIEAEYLDARLQRSVPLPRALKAFIVRKMGGVVFHSQRAAR